MIGMMSFNQMSIYHTILYVHDDIMMNSSSDKIQSKFTQNHKHSLRKNVNNDIKVIMWPSTRDSENACYLANMWLQIPLH